MQSRKSLQDKAYEYLKNQIMDGAFEKGKIYSLAAITASLNMSRTPVRDALLSLSQENLVDILYLLVSYPVHPGKPSCTP